MFCPPSNQDDFKSLAERGEYYHPLSFKDIKTYVLLGHARQNVIYSYVFIYLLPIQNRATGTHRFIIVDSIYCLNVGIT